MVSHTQNCTLFSQIHEVFVRLINKGTLTPQSSISPSPQAHHQEILSQQQDLIIATQSAQALLDKQAQVLSPAEKDKLQRDIKELKGRYESSLTQAEQQMKQIQAVQEEFHKFKADFEEFETWIHQADGQMEELGTSADNLDTLRNNLQRQKSFSEDVISHKGDLRFINISGQKVLDAAKACDRGECNRSDGLPAVDMSGTCNAVREKLDSAGSRYKALHTQVMMLFFSLFNAAVSKISIEHNTSLFFLVNIFLK